MMDAQRHITWENFLHNYIEPGDPAAHTLTGQPHTELFVERGGIRIGLRIRYQSMSFTPDIQLEFVDVNVLRKDEFLFIELSTSHSSLFEPFYALLTNIADLIQLEGIEINAAIQGAVAQFSRMTKTIPLLPDERILGLLGELWVLRRLLSTLGSSALAAWTGPRGEAHDFRFRDIELEVKTTRNSTRMHVISSLSQLTPSPRHQLYLVSLQVGLAGSGRGQSLPEAIESLLAVLSDMSAIPTVEALLASAGYDATHAHLYRDRYVLRSKPILVPVDQDCPRITESALFEAVRADLMARIQDVKYRVNVEGLGHPDGTVEFLSVLPGDCDSGESRGFEEQA